MSERKDKIIRITEYLFFLGIFLAVSLLTPFYGGKNKINDNYLISMVMSGSLGEGNTAIPWFNPVLTSIGSLIHQAMPAADVFRLIQRSVVVISFAFGLYFTVFRKGSADIRATAVAGAFFTFFPLAFNITNSNFTIAAAYCAAVGLYLACECHAGIQGAICLFLGTLFRKEGALLVIPFFLLRQFFVIIRSADRKRETEGVLKKIVPMFIVMILAISPLEIRNASPEFSEIVKNDSDRSYLWDIAHLPYEENEDTYRTAGISKSEFKLSTSLITGETTWFTKERIGYLAEQIKSVDQKKEKSGEAFANCLVLVPVAAKMFPIMAFALILGVVCIVADKKNAPEMLLAVFGIGVITSFFYLTGRCNDRVGVPLAIAMIFETFALLKRGTDKKVDIFSYIPAILAFAVFAAGPMLEIKPYQDPIHAVSSGWLSEHEEKKSVYVWDPHSLNAALYSMYFGDGKIVSPEEMRKNIVTGDWYFSCPIYETYLRSTGIANPVGSLTDENVYYVSVYEAEYADPICEFLNEISGVKVSKEKVGELNGAWIWKFRKDADSYTKKR